MNININIYIISLYISFSIQELLEEGVYNLLFGNYYLQYSKKKVIISDFFKHPSSYFCINKINKEFYYLKIINTNYRLSYSENMELNFIQQKINNYTLTSWQFIKINNNYIIKNKDNCFIKITKFKINCEKVSIEEATQLNLIKLFEEVKENKKDNELIEKEPIDALIKYIDLRDQNVTRIGIHQIEKDFDNEELKYSIRSIFMNIPWIRKIFILMPNEKVRYFKEYDLIKNNIVYVKDSDFLGYDSSNINAFLFRYWNMKKFGISDNFIIFDDDCFIGKKLKKKDFFYVENGEVVPLIITSKFLKIDNDTTQINYNLFKSKAIKSKEEQNDDIFNYSLYITYLLIINTFKRDSLIIPKFTHNAIPVNLKELREVFDIVNNSSFKSSTLYSLFREIGYVQFQEFFLAYTFIKFNRKVRHLSYRYIKINDTVLGNFKYSLFCINKGSFNYSYLTYYKAKIVMEYLFPNPTPYEKIDYSFPNISFNVVYSIEKEMELNNEKINISNVELLLLLLIISLLFLKIYFNNKYVYKAFYNYLEIN